MNPEQALEALRLSLDDLCRDVACEECTPIMESDVAAYIYHRLLSHGVPPSSAYLTSRVCGEHARSRRPDLVIGALRTPAACVEPLLIAEIKAFQRWGMSWIQQMRRRLEGVLTEDIPSLGQMRDVIEFGRVEILADFARTTRGDGYMGGIYQGRRRIDTVATACESVGAGLVWLHALDGALTAEWMIQPSSSA